MCLHTPQPARTNAGDEETVIVSPVVRSGNGSWCIFEDSHGLNLLAPARPVIAHKGVQTGTVQARCRFMAAVACQL